MKQEWKKGWKVIRKKDRMSCTADRRKNPVTYLKNEDAKRPEDEGPLAVFKTRDAARYFKRMNTAALFCCGKDWKIVKCTYIKSTALGLWEWVYGSCYERSKHMLPNHTDFADSVTCLE